MFNVAKLDIQCCQVRGGWRRCGWMFNVVNCECKWYPLHLPISALQQELSWNWIYNFLKPAPETKADTKFNQRFTTRHKVSQNVFSSREIWSSIFYVKTNKWNTHLSSVSQKQMQKLITGEKCSYYEKRSWKRKAEDKSWKRMFWWCNW